jgi:predicted RNA-binding protein with PIN domain
VDGSNFLGTVPGFDLGSDSSREALITRLQDFAHEHPSFRLIAYFDGQKTSVRRAGGVEIRFTQRGKPADFFILEALRALPEAERRRALLVTADRDLADKARRLGTKVEAPTSFHRRLPTFKRAAVGERGLSADEVSAWEEFFRKPPEQGKSGGKR